MALEAAKVPSALKAIQLSAEDVARSQDRVVASAAGVGRGVGGLQGSFTAAGYAFQDFTSTTGDVGQKLNSIANNIPAIVGGMGTLGTAVSVVSVAGIALYRNWDSVAGLWRDRNPFLDEASTRRSRPTRWPRRSRGTRTNWRNSRSGPRSPTPRWSGWPR
jgi:hypothetical protein